MATNLSERRVKTDVREYSALRCPMQGLLNILTGPWTTYILWLIHLHGEMRFGQIKKQLPNISAKVLTNRLRMLEDAGIIWREQTSSIPPSVTYGFTERGHQLHDLLNRINDLAQSWATETGAVIKTIDENNRLGLRL